MRRTVHKPAAIAAASVLLAGLLYLVFGGGGGYTATIVFPAATNLNTGGAVDIHGFQVGTVQHLAVRDGEAMVTVSIDSKYAPLHAGTKAAIDYRSLLGERYVELTPGARSNPPIPSGGVLTGGEDRVELDQVVSQLDPATRAKLVALLPQLATAFGGTNTADVNQTITQAAPAVQALGQVLNAVGQDGLALHQLVVSMAALSSRLVQRQSDLVGTIQGMDSAFGAVSQQQASLSEAIGQLPATLNDAQQTLGHLPLTTTKVTPLLDQLKPVSASLTSFSAQLDPVLSALQPVSSLLVPTLTSLSSLLRYTPGLLSVADATLPSLTEAAYPLEPVANFLRPYTPELAGFVTNWNSWFSTYNLNGHFLHGQTPVGPISVAGFQIGGISVPGGGSLGGGQPLQGVEVPNPPPGFLDGEPPTDAAGSAVQAGQSLAQSGTGGNG